MTSRCVFPPSRRVTSIVASLCLGPVLGLGQSARGEADPDVWEGVEVFEIRGESPYRNLLETPESFVAFDRDEIETFGVQDVRDTLRLVPNANTSPSNRGNNGITIRGINSEGIGGAGANLRPLASLVIDGATQSFAGLRRGARGLWDVQQIEIFRGPQSTLRGRNALAGVILVETADPSYEWEAAVRSRLATFPEGESRSDDIDQWDAAFALSGPIVDHQVAFRLAGEIARDEHGVRALQPEFEDLDRGEYQQLRGKLLVEPDVLSALRIELTASYAKDDPAIVEVTENDDFSFDDFTLAVVPPASERRATEVLNLIADLRLKLLEAWRLESVTSWTQTDVRFDTPFPEVFRREESRIDRDWTQDLRLSFAPSDDLTVIAGAFGAFTRNEIDSFIEFNSVFVFQDQESTRENLNVALFGEIRWRPLPRFLLTLGLRWDRDRFSTSFDDRLGSEQGQETRQTDAFLPRATLSFDLTASQRISATVSRGYRAGFVDTSGFRNRVDPEFLWAYEIAYRGSFVDDLVVLNANGFFYDWRDQQVNVENVGGASRTLNAGRSRVFGAELGVQWRPFAGLAAGASFGWLETEILEFEDFGGSREGNEFPEAPRFSASLRASYEHESGLSISGDWSFQDSFKATGDLTNAEGLEVASRSLLNLGLGYSTSRLGVTLFVRNVLDEKFVVGRDNLGSVFVGDRRLVGLELTIRFRDTKGRG